MPEIDRNQEKIVQNALVLKEEFTYLLGPIKIALRPRIITAQQLADLETYGQAMWDDSIKLEQMWHAGELDAYIDIEEEELEIERQMVGRIGFKPRRLTVGGETESA